MVILKFVEIRKKLRPRTKYRNVEKLVDIITYFCLRSRYISINYSHIIKNSTLSKKEFNDFYLQVRRFLPKYKDHNRQEYILKRVFEVSWYFNLGIPFYYQAKKILLKLWEGVKNTTDNVLAGLASSISALCSKDFKDKVKVSAICDYLGIRMSTIQMQVKKKIIERFDVGGFVSLVKSSGLLKRIFETLGLMEVEKVKKKDSPVEDKIELVLGNVAEIFKFHDNTDCYYFALPTENNSSIVVFVRINHPLMDFKKLSGANKKSQKFLEFNVVNYYKGKDPPDLL